MVTHLLHLDFERPPLSENDRHHWAVKAERVRGLRDAATLWGRRIRGAEHVEVRLRWIVRDARRRDEDNLIPTFKALCDGLVDAHVVPDDTPRYMTKVMPSIAVDRRVRPHLELLVTPTSAPDVPNVGCMCKHDNRGAPAAHTKGRA
jgi:crossover junction endodeoxyribonuclease RusA